MRPSNRSLAILVGMAGIVLNPACQTPAPAPIKYVEGNLPYSIRWPEGWEVEDLSEHNRVRESRAPGLISFVGARPAGSDGLYEQAILVSDAPNADLLRWMRGRMHVAGHKQVSQS